MCAPLSHVQGWIGTFHPSLAVPYGIYRTQRL